MSVQGGKAKRTADLLMVDFGNRQDAKTAKADHKIWSDPFN